MSKRINLLLITLIVIMLILKPVGTIGYYFEFNDTDHIHINYIVDNNTGKVVFLSEEEMEKLYHDFIDIRYILRFHRQNPKATPSVGIHSNLSYSFKIKVNGIYYSISMDNKEIIVWSDYYYNSFKITNHEKIYALFEELFFRG